MVLAMGMNSAIYQFSLQERITTVLAIVDAKVA